MKIVPTVGSFPLRSDGKVGKRKEEEFGVKVGVPVHLCSPRRYGERDGRHQRS